MSTGIPIQEKACTRCSEVKPLDAFGKHKVGRDGLRSVCKSCNVDAAKQWTLANPDKVRAASARAAKRRRAENPEENHAYLIKWRAENPEKVQAQSLKWRRENHEKNRVRLAKWHAENPEKNRASRAKRRASLLQATPPWADLDAIKAVYVEQQFYLDLGLDVHVDHIIPLQGKTVCGLHVHWNLRVVLAEDNIRKGNKIDPTLALAHPHRGGATRGDSPARNGG